MPLNGFVFQTIICKGRPREGQGEAKGRPRGCQFQGEANSPGNPRRMGTQVLNKFHRVYGNRKGGMPIFQ